MVVVSLKSFSLFEVFCEANLGCLAFERNVSVKENGTALYHSESAYRPMVQLNDFCLVTQCLVQNKPALSHAVYLVAPGQIVVNDRLLQVCSGVSTGDVQV